MKVAQRIKSLFHDHGSLGLSEELLLSNMIEKFASLAEPKLSNVSE